MNLRSRFLWAVSCSVMLSACGFQTSDGTSETSKAQEETRSTGVALTMDTLGDTNVYGIRFQIAKCENPNENIVFNQIKDLEDLMSPGMIPEFVNRPLDENSAHLFSDYFVVLDAGCYHIAATPVDENGTSCTECSQAFARNVQVYDGLTTEILLISQCNGPERGALDVVGALNHPPVVEGLTYAPSKFVYECEETIICATASDPDNDPIEFVWKKTGGKKLHGGIDNAIIDRYFVKSRTEENGHVTECLHIAPLWNGDYQFEVSVYDQFHLDNGDLVRAEDFVGKDSHAKLAFPLYANWDIEMQCYDAESKQFHHLPGVREINRIQGCYPIWPSQFFCSAYYWDETDVTCPGGVFSPETVYPACSSTNGELPD